jgi:colicin import membrane protein
MSDFESLDDFGDESFDGPQATVVKRGGDLVPIRIDDPAMAFAAGGLEPLLVAIDAKAREEVKGLDISSKANQKAIASTAAKVAKSKTAILEAKRNYTRDEKERLKIVDGEGARAEKFLDALKDEIRKPLTDWEDVQKARMAAHEAAITAMGNLQQWDGALPTSALIKDRLEKLTAYANRPWEEFADKAGKVATTVKHWLHVALEKAEKHEAEQAELAELRKKTAEREQEDRDKRIRQEAADAAVSAERTRVASEERAKHQAEENKRLAGIKNAPLSEPVRKPQPAPVIKGVPTEEQMAEAFEPTMADKKRIEQEALDDLVEIAGFPDKELCRDLLKAIVNGKVRHVEIVY